jgi:O-methyltransferase
MLFPKRLLHFLFEDRALAPRLRLLRLAGKLLVPTYRFKWPQLDWWKNEEFTGYLNRFGELQVLNTDRKWMVYQLLRLVAHVPGDTAECGVFRGATSYLICCANQGSQAGTKTHHLFDSFEGLSQPGQADGTHWRKGDLKCEIETVRKALSDFDKLTFHPGWIPDRFQDVEDRKFSFVHIDVDLAEPTRESLAFFYPRMEAGGIIVCDDYGQSTSPGATQAVDHFLAGKSEKMLMLPEGGGFLIVKAPTAKPAWLVPVNAPSGRGPY